MSHEPSPFDHAADEVVKLGNHLADADPSSDLWDIADGLLAGAIHYWLYAHQPCGRPDCRDCAPIATAELRLQELKRLSEELVRESGYFHAPTDRNVGHA
jgi:hypothetical protein